MYDRHEQLKFFVTGSNAEMRSVEIDTHLTGRVISYENFPFSLSELLRSSPNNDILIPETNSDNSIAELLYHDKEKLLYYIERAFRFSFFPEVCKLSNEELVSDILNQYFTNVLFKDIIPRFSIRNSRVVEELAYYLSTNFTSEFSYNKLAKVVSSNENTVKDYISFFEKAYLFYVLPFFEYSLKKQLRREKKIYISDVGLRTATAFQFSQDTGRYVENLVFNALRSKNKDIYYWKSKTGAEIDFLVRHKGTMTAVNVCYADVMPERKFVGFKHLVDENISTVKNIIVSRNLSDCLELDGVVVEVVPIWEFLFTV
jgi:predicted AAA+ superfamily ATPase